MEKERLEVRLEPERHARLRRLAAARHRTLSDMVRDLIDDAYAELERADRVAAARELGAMNAFDLGSPEELRAEIETKYDDLPDLP